MSEYDADMYDKFSSGVKKQVKALRIILDSLQVPNILFNYLFVSNFKRPSNISFSHKFRFFFQLKLC